MPMSQTGRLFAGTLVLLLISHLISTAEIPDLGIALDWFTDSENLISFSTIIGFNSYADNSSPVDYLTDAQIVGLGSRATDRMRTIGADRVPNAMAVVCTGNEIFFASSIKGPDAGKWLNPRPGDSRPNILIDAAGGCRLTSGHRTDGRCGEINVMDLIYGWKGQLNFQGTRSRIMVWGKYSNEPLHVMPPCGNPPGRYGCEAFLRTIANPQDPEASNKPLDPNNLRVIPTNTPPDTNWPDGLTFTVHRYRFARADAAEVCQALDHFDPNTPELRRRTNTSPVIRL